MTAFSIETVAGILLVCAERANVRSYTYLDSCKGVHLCVVEGAPTPQVQILSHIFQVYEGTTSVESPHPPMHALDRVPPRSEPRTKASLPNARKHGPGVAQYVHHSPHTAVVKGWPR